MKNNILVLGVAVVVLVTACEKTTPPEWKRISKEEPCPVAAPDGTESTDCRTSVFFLDTANITRKSGVLYVTLQTRMDGSTPEQAGGAHGIIHAEANCRLKKLEPAGLHEDMYGADGKATGNRLAVISADDEAAILKDACAK